MYEQHFGFSRPLFEDGIARDDAVFRSDSTAGLSADLEIALRRKDAVAVLSGPSGCGKTTIAADALRQISTRLAFSCISQPPLTGHELLEQLLTDFGYEPYKRSRVERLQLWRQFLSEMAATDTRVCLLVEGAERLEPEVLQALHSLTQADAAQSPGANVVLTTTAGPEILFAQAANLALGQRIRLRRSIEPLTAAETDAYLEFRCAFGGVPGKRVLEPDTGPAIHELSGGIIRIIDNLLEAALLAAAASGDARIGRASVERIAEQDFGIARLSPGAVEALLESAAEGADRGAQTPGTDPGIREAPDIEGPEIPTLTEYLADGTGRVVRLLQH